MIKAVITMHAAAKTTENNCIFQTVDSQNTLNLFSEHNKAGTLALDWWVVTSSTPRRDRVPPAEIHVLHQT